MKRPYVTVGLLCLGLAMFGCEGGVGDHGHDHANGDHDHAHGEGDHDHGDGHDHAEGASDGVVARLTDGAGADVGFFRLKLHDDKGDLEAWVARDAEFSEPLDLPLDTTITVTFVDKEGRSVKLAVRNRDQNEDEDGKANIRDGKTNYFIFPGDTGADASWLKGADFLSTTKAALSVEGKDCATPAFVLRPHTHGEGHSR